MRDGEEHCSIFFPPLARNSKGGGIFFQRTESRNSWYLARALQTQKAIKLILSSLLPFFPITPISPKPQVTKECRGKGKKIKSRSTKIVLSGKSKVLMLRESLIPPSIKKRNKITFSESCISWRMKSNFTALGPSDPPSLRPFWQASPKCCNPGGKRKEKSRQKIFWYLLLPAAATARGWSENPFLLHPFVLSNPYSPFFLVVAAAFSTKYFYFPPQIKRENRVGRGSIV